jgi:hypothetical protein
MSSTVAPSAVVAPSTTPAPPAKGRRITKQAGRARLGPRITMVEEEEAAGEMGTSGTATPTTTGRRISRRQVPCGGFFAGVAAMLALGILLPE